MISLMLLSRMYLGRHFLADVLGGLVVGGTIVVVTYPLFIRPTSRGWLLDVVRLRLAADARTSTLLVCLLLMPLATLMLTPLVEPGDAGRLFGLGVASLLIVRRGLPDDTGTFAKRVGRVLLGGALYMVATFLGWSIDRSAPCGQ